MPRPHYRLPASRRRRSGRFLLLLVLLIIGTGLWFWWHQEKKQKAAQPARTSVLPVVQPSPAPPRSNAIAKPAPQPKPAPATNVIVVTPPAPTNNVSIAPASKPAPKLEVLPKPVPSALTTNTGTFPRPPRDTLEAQIALARLVISSGSIDGVSGSQTRAALTAFQRANNLTTTGELDAPTRTALSLVSPPLVTLTITSNDLARLQPLSKTWLGKSQQTALDYETLLELVAERGHASPNWIRRLNPAVNWTNVAVGAEIQIPDVEYPSPPAKAAFIVIRLAERRLQAFDANTNLLAHFPCSIAAKFEKRPVGELHVTAIAPNPDYTFNPEVFPESEEARQLKTKLILPPGPNNPVGTAWISLDRPGYGMHGTPSPEQVGRTESHGCFRLANWNAEYLIKLVTVGTPVLVEP